MKRKIRLSTSKVWFWKRIEKLADARRREQTAIKGYLEIRRI
jgi:hypothetical protein